MHDYQELFSAVEKAVIARGLPNMPRDEIIRELDRFKEFENRKLSDEQYYWILVYVVFYSGFKAAIVTDKLGIIKTHFPDISTVATYLSNDEARILSDQRMIKNKLKVNACIQNAMTIQKLSNKFGGFSRYLESFNPMHSDEGLSKLRSDLQRRFIGIGPITVLHFMTDIGLPVLKPDRALCRVFYRLGLIENEDSTEDAIYVGRRISKAIGQPIRYVDRVFVAHGQVESPELGILRGVCLKNHPACDECALLRFCQFEGSSR